MDLLSASTHSHTMTWFVAELAPTRQTVGFEKSPLEILDSISESVMFLTFFTSIARALPATNKPTKPAKNTVSLINASDIKIKNFDLWKHDRQ